MKFEYETKEDDRECVAYMTHMNCEPENKCLVIKEPDGRTVWMYYNGVVKTFSHLDVLWDPDDSTHKFYPGDKVTITF